MAPPSPSPAAPAVHLVVVQHGLWGVPANMMGVVDNLERSLVTETTGERIVIENSGERGGVGWWWGW
jgi:hypothetical protein